MLQARELAAFTVVGTAATAVQLGIVATGVRFGLSPLGANGLGFLASCVVSFFGHACWSFPLQRRSIPPALRRFAALSLVSFCLNEVCYAGALRLTTLDYRVASFAVIAFLAVVQLLASKYWAFAFDERDGMLHAGRRAPQEPRIDAVET